jgi:DNA replication protein DnaC
VSMADETYNCVICKDAHWVHPRRKDGLVDFNQIVPCLCARDRIEREKTQRLLQWCELPPVTESMTFENFKPSKGLEDVLNQAKRVARGELQWLTIISEVNHGKTHLAVAVCREWLKQGKPARYAYVPLLMEELRRGYKDGRDDSYDSRFEHFLNVPLLVLDDLGVENSTPWVQEKLDTIVDYRLMHELVLVVTTNLSLDKLSTRIASRLMRKGEIAVIKAPEYHKERKGRS